ncbi:MAG: HPr family phosphocarrier protein [Lachnospiraceae bacterium]|nr:HPr family phosphocarrier protein [Lachnospiraceae bacterium]
MREFHYTITDAEGIHARPAGELVKLAKEFSCDIKMSSGGKEGDCKRIFGIMGLAVKQGMDVKMSFDGEDEDKACEEIEAFMKENM